MKSKVMKMVVVGLALWVASSQAEPPSANAASSLDMEKGIITDSRDGKTYKAVKIGTQIWMGENLNYEINDSYCYEDKESNCDKYGRLYTRYAAKKACPSGWHIPDTYEFGELLAFALSTSHGVYGKDSAKNLRSSRWGGNDFFGFSVLPTGYRSAYGSNHLGFAAYFWSYRGSAQFPVIFRNEGGAERAEAYLDHDRYAIRCLLDSNEYNEIMRNSQKELPDAAKTGTMTDHRDGHSYKTVEIGNQVWMAENLNYKTKFSKCYDDNPDNCKKYGSLYNERDAIYVCPEGFHVPTIGEFREMIQFTGGEEEAGKKLKSKSGWIENEWTERGNGIDSYGFAALPAGNGECYDYDRRCEYKNLGVSTWFINMNYFHIRLYYDSDRVSFFSGDKNFRSIRCVKDPFEGSQIEIE